MAIKRASVRPMKRVAVVEDDQAIGNMLRELLSMEGFDVLLLSDGRTAVDRVRRSGCRAVILDKRLPGCDGIEIVHQLRDASDTNDLPVVMLTAERDDQSTWEAWKAGVNYFMNKPFDPKELVRVLHNVISI